MNRSKVKDLISAQEYGTASSHVYVQILEPIPAKVEVEGQQERKDQEQSLETIQSIAHNTKLRTKAKKRSFLTLSDQSELSEKKECLPHKAYYWLARFGRVA